MTTCAARTRTNSTASGPRNGRPQNSSAAVPRPSRPSGRPSKSTNSITGLPPPRRQPSKPSKPSKRRRTSDHPGPAAPGRPEHPARPRGHHRGGPAGTAAAAGEECSAAVRRDGSADQVGPDDVQDLCVDHRHHAAASRV
ncbi:hypothetical protein ACFFX0_08955 [Citricoccus parietis]|uniref:Uncharacterized protein n=1 Tax=Citricoccus parietis TaxID=592307 RepID=A0ABV5FXA8_9MICC